MKISYFFTPTTSLMTNEHGKSARKREAMVPTACRESIFVNFPTLKGTFLKSSFYQQLFLLFLNSS